MELDLIEDKIKNDYLTKDLRLDSGDSDFQIKILEQKKSNILPAEEELWRQSRATWLQKGDQNKKKFH
jgi:hypothetical protein